MALVVKDRVRETSTTTGTGTFTLDGAVTGYQSFNAIGNGNTTYYAIYLQGSNQWEVGIGTYSSTGPTLTRDTLLASSTGNTVDFDAGTKDVFVTYPAGRSVYYDTNTNVTVKEMTLSDGTGTGVLYLDSISRQVKSGTSLSFDGSTFATTAGVTFSATTQNIALGTSQTSGLFTVGGASQTGTQTFDQSTKTHTLNIGAGATENAATKTVNIATAGVSGSTTTITIGSTNGTSVTANGTWSYASNPTFSGGTANGVLYLNGSKVATSGSALTFDGSNLSLIEANGSGAKTILMQGGASAGDYGIFAVANGSTVKGRMVAGAGSDEFRFDTAGGASTPYVWYTGASYTETMRLTTTGLKSSIAGSNANPVFSYTSGTNTGIFFPAADKLGFVAGGGTNDMVLTTTGLGIGTSSPDAGYQLTAFATTTAAIRIRGGGAGSDPARTASLSLLSSGNEEWIVRGANDSMRFLQGSTERARIDTSGTLILRQSSNAANTSVSFNTTVQNALTLDSAAKLTLNAGANTEMWINTSASGYLQIGQFTNGAFIGTSSSDATAGILRFGTAGATKGQFSTDGTFRVKGAGTAGSTDAVQFSGSAPASALLLDSSGNLGLGVTPSAWGSGQRAFQVRNSAMMSFDTNGVTQTFNAYHNGSNWLYVNSTFSSLYTQGSGQHQWYTAPSGTAGNAITFTQAMTLDASGDLVVGDTSTGSIRISAVKSNPTRGILAHVYNIGSSGLTGAQIQFTQNTIDNWVIGQPAATNAFAFWVGRNVASDGTEVGRFTSGGIFCIGNGETAASPSNGVLSATGGSGTNIAGASLTIRGGASTGSGDGGAIIFATAAAGASGTTVRSAAERARITSGGALLVNNTTAVNSELLGVVSAGNAFLVKNTQNTGTARLVYQNGAGTIDYFYDYASATNVGSITNTTSAVSYNTSSDYRLKDNQQPLTGSGAFIDALQPKTWDWKVGGKGVGFIAHEVQEVSPGSVVGTKDAVDADGKPIMQAMEYGSAEFIANIIAELQSLRARVAQLESKGA